MGRQIKRGLTNNSSSLSSMDLSTSCLLSSLLLLYMSINPFMQADNRRFLQECSSSEFSSTLDMASATLQLQKDFFFLCCNMLFVCVKDVFLPKCKVTDSLKRIHSCISITTPYRTSWVLKQGNRTCLPLDIFCFLKSSRKLVNKASQPFAFWRWQQLWKNLQFHSGLMWHFCVLQYTAELLPQSLPQDRCDSRDHCWVRAGNTGSTI